MNWRSAHRTIEKMTWKNHQRVHVSLSFTQITLNKPLLSYGFWRREIIEAMPTIWPYCIFLHAKSPSFSSNGWNTFKKVITVPHEVHVFYSSGLAHYTNMYTMREHFLLRLRAVYIYQPLYFFLILFFVKDRRQVIYSYFTVIAHFFIKSTRKKSSCKNIQSQLSRSNNGRL